MATYAELLDELARWCGKHNLAGSTDFAATCRNAFRQALEGAAARQKFPWWRTECRINLGQGQTRLSLPPDCLFLEYFFDPDEAPFVPKEYRRRPWYAASRPGIPFRSQAETATVDPLGLQPCSFGNAPGLPPEHGRRFTRVLAELHRKIQ